MAETPHTKRCRRAALKVAMASAPFLLPALAQVYFEESTEIPTMSVNPSGRVRVNPTFVHGLSDGLLGGCVAHELMHLMLIHKDRAGGRDLDRWNIASDMAINQILREGSIPLIPEAVYPPYGHERSSAEELFDTLPQQSPRQGVVGSGCGVEPEDGPNEQEVQRWRETAIQAAAIAPGSRAGDAFARVLAPRRSRISYAQILRSLVSRALSAHGRDDQTWTKINRRSPEGVILPGWKATKARGSVIIDSSGSMSDEMLAQAASETAAIQKVCQGVKLYLVVHDASVQFSGWVDAKTHDSVQRVIRGRGGTDFYLAYREVEQKAGHLDFVIHLTDGVIFGNWPKPPANCRKFIVAKIGSGGDVVPPGTVEISVSV